MPPRIHEVRFSLLAAALLALLAASSAHAQQPPPGAIGRIEGLDVTVDGGTAAGNPAAAAVPSIYVSSGSTVTVHSGKAQMILAAGGHLDICGPARFTVLQSGDAVTLALSFGRIHVQLPAGTALRLFTPTIIATPLDINGAARDVTLGLDIHDSLCVLASSGALRLEHQFSGENLVVPQSGEFFLDSGKLAPIVGAPGTCDCTLTQAQISTPPALPAPAQDKKPDSLEDKKKNASLGPLPALAKVLPAPQLAGLEDNKSNSAVAKPPAAPPLKQTPAAPAPPPQLTVEFSVPAHRTGLEDKKVNDTRPVPAPPKTPELAPPPEYRPEYKVIMPPLTFSATSPAPPPEPSLDTILLVRIARVQPVYEFTGRVEPPPGPEAKRLNSPKSRPAASPAAPSATSTAAIPAPSASASSTPHPGSPSASAALPASTAAAQPQVAATRSAAANAQLTPAAKPKSGFWAKLKHIFGGSTVEAAPKPCQGTGCH
jgi:hypothetical protein